MNCQFLGWRLIALVYLSSGITTPLTHFIVEVHFYNASKDYFITYFHTQCSKWKILWRQNYSQKYCSIQRNYCSVHIINLDETEWWYGCFWRTGMALRSVLVHFEPCSCYMLIFTQGHSHLSRWCSCTLPYLSICFLNSVWCSCVF